MEEKGDKDFDKLYKLRPLITHLSEKFLSVLRLSKHQAVDESMVKFKGRSSLKQYMPKKPIKRGYKIWMRCNENGFASQFQIYTGKPSDVEKNLGERVVRDLTQPIYGKNHILYIDNFFPVI
ncbi:piggyBac transposable element-derived protein 3 [Trichonephila clavata]|uniref:PiggyBac transposable element-derived protein 3 n=1 Tax=Trichonephila clavata TaxID=2740835 RepID=A0A8X6GQ64_TRICU|nr:piggyBac transposable element-derived protein 3 [Trichonephila clavata]